MSRDRPPRSSIASRSRRRCAQQSWRRQLRYQVYARQRSVTNQPQQHSPKISRATLPQRDRRPTKTVTEAVTAVHSQAWCCPSRQPGSSRDAAGCCWTALRASPHGHRQSLHGRVLQVRNGPHAERQAEQVGHDAVGGPLRPVIRPRAQRRHGLHPRAKPPVDTPAGSSPRVTAPQAGQPS
jgi:hypothetical protein